MRVSIDAQWKHIWKPHVFWITYQNHAWFLSVFSLDMKTRQIEHMNKILQFNNSMESFTYIFFEINNIWPERKVIHPNLPMFTTKRAKRFTIIETNSI